MDRPRQDDVFRCKEATPMRWFKRRARLSFTLLGASAAALLTVAQATAQVPPPAATKAMPTIDAPTEVGDKGKKDSAEKGPPASAPATDAPVACENSGFDWSKYPKIPTLA